MPDNTTLKPLFLCGTLQALPLLAWVLTGDKSNTDTVAPLLRPAKIFGYARYSIHRCDYPAIVKTGHDPSSMVDGYLLTPETASQRKKLDDFEGETYRVTDVTAVLEDGERVHADIYLWNGDMEALSSEPWDFATFERERLEDWLDLYEGFEFVGEE